MGLLIDDATLEVLRHGDEDPSYESWLDKLEELYSSDEFSYEDDLMHYGVAHDEDPPGRGSGRYPFGTGDRTLQDHWEINDRIKKLKKSIDPETGRPYTEATIAKLMGYYQIDRKTGKPILDKNGEPKGSTTVLRAKESISSNYVREHGYRKSIEKYDNSIDPDTGKPYTNVKIGKLLGIGESTVRQIRNSESAAENSMKAQRVAETLKELVDKKGMIDVGRGAELALECSPDKLKVAFQLLREEGYNIEKVWIEQVGGANHNKTFIQTLYPPGVKYEDVYKNMSSIMPIVDNNGENTLTKLGMEDPVRVSLDRVKVKYKDEGGLQKDGTVEIRPGLEDLDLGNAKYAQVRIAVDASSELKDGDRYIKGMAFYNPDLPEGVDILVNSNKKTLDDALKKMKDDKDNPFGSTVYQTKYEDAQGEKKLSAINIVGDIYGVDQHKEGAWGEWSRNLPSQFLSKQSETLIKQQLKLKVQEKQQEYEEILALNNPVVKKQMLKDFAESCDSAAVDLKAAPLPGQRVQVILPLETIKDNEVYAPNYENGQTLALIRYPHTGPFEIPIVKVNNNNREAKKFMYEAKDAIGMNATTAQILSGADFDGDTVTCIPMTRKNAQGEFEKTVNIKGIGNGQKQLKGLKNFDPDVWTALDENGNVKPGVKLMNKRTKGLEMGVVSNLITDMSLKGCDDEDELERAVKYSMVVIDAEKHKYDYKAAEKYYNIAELKKKYQVKPDGSTGGASTLISAAKSQVNDIDQRQAWQPSKDTIDPVTGEKIYKLAPHRFYDTYETVYVKDPETGKKIKIGEEKYTDSKGRERTRSIYKTEKVKVTKVRKMSSTKMAEARDASQLLSANPSNKELLYRDFANKMKSMGNEARKEWLKVPNMERNPEAAKKYKAEVDSLNKKYIEARLNSPRERQAQIIATEIINQKLKENPDLRQDKEEFKRVKGQALIGARARAGAKKDRVKFTEKEWEAINAGAISETRLKNLLAEADSDNYKRLATPKASRLSDATVARIQGLLDAGWTRKDIEDAGYASMDTIIRVDTGNIN